jgi:hypothetical protein
VNILLKISGRTKLIFNTIAKLICSMLIGCIIMVTMIYSLYTPTYEVFFKGESLGFVSNKKSVQSRIDEFIQNGDADNVGYVILEEQPVYEFTLLKKGIELSDESVVAKVIDECVVYYRVYGINIDGEEKFIVDTIKE